MLVIICFILVTWMFDSGVVLWGEIRCWSLKRVKELRNELSSQLLSALIVHGRIAFNYLIHTMLFNTRFGILQVKQRSYSWAYSYINSFGKISAQPHTKLCIQFLNRENNDKNNTLPLGKQIRFTIEWGCAEILPQFLLFGTKISI